MFSEVSYPKLCFLDGLVDHPLSPLDVVWKVVVNRNAFSSKLNCYKAYRGAVSVGYIELFLRSHFFS